MGIAPVDLQTLFTQIEKVGKTQAAEKDGQVLHQSIQGAQLQKKTEQAINQVNEAQNTGDDGTEKVKDRQHGQEGGKQNGERKENEEDENDETKPSVLTDLSLGRKIDISY
jgi:type II secretory pathway pseudopilin PulG